MNVFRKSQSTSNVSGMGLNFFSVRRDFCVSTYFWELQILRKAFVKAELLYLLLKYQLGEKADPLEQQSNIRLREMRLDLGVKENILHWFSLVPTAKKGWSSQRFGKWSLTQDLMKKSAEELVLAPSMEEGWCKNSLLMACS